MHRPAHPLALLLALVSLGVGVAAREAGAIEPAAPSAAAHDDVARLPRDPGLTLSEAVRLAAANDPGAIAVGGRVEEAEAIADDARRWLADAPTAFATHVDDGLASDEGFRQWDAGLELPLWWPGQRAATRAQAVAAGEAAALAARVHRLEVAGRARAALAELDLASLREALAADELAAQRALVARVARAVELEELARRDLLLARAAETEHEALLLAAREERIHAEHAWRRETSLERAPASGDETAADATAIAEHPSLRLADREVARAEAEVERLAFARWSAPAIAIGTQHERSARGQGYSDRVVAGVRLPLGRRGALASGLAAAARARAEARAARARVERRLRGHLDHAVHRSELAEARAGLAAARAALARDHLALAQRGFDLGEIDLETLIRARLLARTAEEAHGEAIVQRRLATAVLNQSIGVLP
ncbi:MAG: TolC family protein [Myxococcota bacterium]